MSNTLNNVIKSIARKAISIELSELKNALKRINDDFYQACSAINNSKGNVIMIGIGKSGDIAAKLANTFLSLGTKTIFLHPSDATHGSLGLIGKNDVIIIFSNSGETSEIINILELIKKNKNIIISFLGNKNSSIAKYSNFVIDTSVSKESCTIGLAPTTSSSMTLVLGHAMSAVLTKLKKFNKEDFGAIHPGGQIGKNLNIKVSHIMKKGSQIPIISESKSLNEAINEMSKKSLGFVIVTKNKKTIKGVFTDGDLRRIIKGKKQFADVKIKDVLNKNFFTCYEDESAYDILKKMRELKINSFPVIDSSKKLVGAVNMFYIINAGVK